MKIKISHFMKRIKYRNVLSALLLHQIGEYFMFHMLYGLCWNKCNVRFLLTEISTLKQVNMKLKNNAFTMLLPLEMLIRIPLLGGAG